MATKSSDHIGMKVSVPSPYKSPKPAEVITEWEFRIDNEGKKMMKTRCSSENNCRVGSACH